MHHLVPKVRVGDVLRGTRTLRRWLRSASIWYALTANVRSKRAGLKVGATLHTPSKNDEFVVIANNDGIFVVWNPKNGIVIPFINPEAPGTPERMSPTIFSTWFIRTEIKETDISTWTDPARYIWLLVQMNGACIKGGDLTPSSLPSFLIPTSNPHPQLLWNPVNVLHPMRVPGGPWAAIPYLHDWTKKLIYSGAQRMRHQREGVVCRNCKQGAGPLYSEIQFFEENSLSTARDIRNLAGKRDLKLDTYKDLDTTITGILQDILSVETTNA